MSEYELAYWDKHAPEYWRPEWPGSPIRRETIWVAGARQRRYESDTRLYIESEGKHGVWEKTKNLALTWKSFPTEKILPDIEFHRSQIAFESFSRSDYNSIDPETIFQNGKEIQRNPAREGTIWLEKNSMRPVREEMYISRALPQSRRPSRPGPVSMTREPPPPQRKVLGMRTTARYDEAPPAGTFTFTPAKGTRVVDLDERYAFWRSRFSGPPLATVGSGSNAFRIHHVAVGQEGEVSVLFSGRWPVGTHRLKQSRRMVENEIAPTDDLRTRYRKLLFLSNGAKTIFDTGDRKARNPSVQVFSPLHPQRGAYPKELIFEEMGADGSVLRLPLPPPLTTELPEYYDLLNPYRKLDGERADVILWLLKSAVSDLQRGRPDREEIAECEALIRERLNERQLPWLPLLQLAQLEEASGKTALATQHIEQARRKFRAQNLDARTYPRELEAALNRLDP